MSFKIGEIAIVNAPYNEYHGWEVEITSRLLNQGETTLDGGIVKRPGYDVIFQDGEAGFAPHHELRKKKPPQVNQDVEESRDKPYDPELTPWNPPKRETVK